MLRSLSIATEEALQTKMEIANDSNCLNSLQLPEQGQSGSLFGAEILATKFTFGSYKDILDLTSMGLQKVTAAEDMARIFCF